MIECRFTFLEPRAQGAFPRNQIPVLQGFNHRLWGYRFGLHAMKRNLLFNVEINTADREGNVLE